jgi:hypothetical protein
VKAARRALKTSASNEKTKNASSICPDGILSSRPINEQSGSPLASTTQSDGIGKETEEHDFKSSQVDATLEGRGHGAGLGSDPLTVSARSQQQQLDLPCIQELAANASVKDTLQYYWLRTYRFLIILWRWGKLNVRTLLILIGILGALWRAYQLACNIPALQRLTTELQRLLSLAFFTGSPVGM